MNDVDPALGAGESEGARPQATCRRVPRLGFWGWVRFAINLFRSKESLERERDMLRQHVADLQRQLREEEDGGIGPGD